MLAALAIINMTVAAALIIETADARVEQVPTAMVATVDTKPLNTDYISWADDLIIKNVKSANDNLNQQLEKIAGDLRRQLDKEKSKLGKKPSKEEEQQFMQLVQKANNQLNQTKQAAVQKSQQLQNSLIAEFRSEVSKVSREIARKNGYLTVFAINDSLLWADESVDITTDVIRKMRYDVYKKAATHDEITTGK